MKELFHRAFLVIAWVGIISAIALLMMMSYWLLKPYDIVDVKQPFKVLNENKTVAIGDDLLLELEVNVKEEYRPVSAPVFVCQSGNLVTLQSRLPEDLPLGKYILVADPIQIPPKIIAGDTCKYVAVLNWRVNPVRVVSETYESEWFSVTEREN